MRASPLRSNFSLRFNPHRLLGAGATRWHTDDLAGRILVSILTDSWEPVQLQCLFLLGPLLRVSILTDSWEPVQHTGE